MSGLIGTSHSKSKVIGRSQDTCKAWVKFSASGNTPTIVDSFNVSSVDAFLYSRWKINFSTTFPNTNFAVVGASSEGTDGSVSVNVFNANYIEVYAVDHAGTAANTPLSIAVFGD
jgi:hypothetical protein